MAQVALRDLVGRTTKRGGRRVGDGRTDEEEEEKEDDVEEQETDECEAGPSRRQPHERDRNHSPPKKKKRTHPIRAVPDGELEEEGLVGGGG